MKPRLLQLMLLASLLALPARAVSPTVSVLYNLFNNCDSTLVQSTNDLLFGTTLTDGSESAESVFVASTNALRRGFSTGFTNLHTFVASDGGQSDGGVALARSGLLFGTTAGLALSNNIFPGGMGSIYRMSQVGAFSVLYRFGTQTNDLGQPLDGASPRATPVCPAGDMIYGTTFQGGSFGYENGGVGYGTVFKIQTNGASFSVLHSISGNDGANPTALIIGADQLLYGVTSFGGANTTVQTNGATGYGTIFQITTNGDFTSLYSFGTLLGSDGTPLDGSQPNSIFQASNGVLYGTAAAGGSHGRGTFFSITTNGSFTLLYTFGTISNAAGLALDGDTPNGALMQGADANFYGVTQFGNPTNAGTIYRMTPQGELTTLFSFATNSSPPIILFQPKNPRGGLLLGRESSLYGTCYAGGTTPGGAGAIYKIGPGIPTIQTPPPLYTPPPRTNIASSTITYSNNVFSVYQTDIRWLLNGTPLTDNATVAGSTTPNLTLSDIAMSDSGTYTLVASNAAGTATSSAILTVVPLLITIQPIGANVAAGVTNVFTVIPTSNLPITSRWKFNGTNLADDGRFSGTTTTNLTINGVLPSDAGSYSVVISNSAGSVTSTSAVLTVQPFLLITAPTNQYAIAGMPASIAIAVENYGPVSYQWQLNGANLSDGPGLSGSTTSNLLLQPASMPSSGTYTVIVSNAFGVTNLSALLAVFPQTAAGCVITNLHTFSMSSTWAPNQLQLGPDRVIYGTTRLGGDYGYQFNGHGDGTFFRVDTNGTITSLHSFNGTNDGQLPLGPLALGSNGSFYGVAENLDYSPMLFSITTNGAAATVTNVLNINDPDGMTMGTDGRVYCTDYDNNIFSVDPTSSAIAKAYSFGTDAYLYRILTLGPDGLLYGATLDKIFKMDYNANVTVLYTITNSAVDGLSPSAYLAWATNGDIFGVTGNGGGHSCGTIFKLSTNGDLTTLHTFGETTNWDGSSYDGRQPLSITWGPDGMLYGLTYDDGGNDGGTVFRISTTGDFETVVWFNPATGKTSTVGYLVVGSDNNLYGTTYTFNSSSGTVYRINLVPDSQPITAIWNGSSTIAVTAATVPGHTYQIQSTQSLAPADWQNIGTSATATSTVITFNDSLSDTQRFYRLVLVQ